MNKGALIKAYTMVMDMPYNTPVRQVLDEEMCKAFNNDMTVGVKSIVRAVKEYPGSTVSGLYDSLHHIYSPSELAFFLRNIPTIYKKEIDFPATRPVVCVEYDEDFNRRAISNKATVHNIFNHLSEFAHISVQKDIEKVRDKKTPYIQILDEVKSILMDNVGKPLPLSDVQKALAKRGVEAHQATIYQACKNIEHCKITESKKAYARKTYGWYPTNG